MSGKTLLAGSVALNAILAAVLVLPKQRHEAAAPEVMPAQTEALAPATPAAPKVVTVTAPSKGFHWSELESSDFQQYMVNLRGVGCPDVNSLGPTRRDRPDGIPDWVVGELRSTAKPDGLGSRALVMANSVRPMLVPETVNPKPDTGNPAPTVIVPNGPLSPSAQGQAQRSRPRTSPARAEMQFDQTKHQC